MTPNNTNPFSLFFNFENKETGEEMTRIFNQYEGVISNQEASLCLSHSVVKANLYQEVKTIILDFSKNHRQLNLSDIKGLFDLAMLDIIVHQIEKGDKIASKRI